MKYLSTTIRLVALLVSLLLTLTAIETFGQQPPAQAPAAPSPSPQSDLGKRQESFQIVWQTVNDLFYDPKFGGVDWAGVRKRYEPQVANVQSDQEFHRLLQQMLNELHQSHFIVVPKESIPKIRLPKADETGEIRDAETTEAEESLDALNYKLTDRLLTGIGIDVRVLAGSAVITRVEPGSSAARVGLRPGFVLKYVGGQSLDSVISEIEKHPLWGEIIRPELPVFLIAGFINGDEESYVSVSYLDGRNRLRRTVIGRERLKGEMSPAIGNLPALYTEFEARRLQGGVGYIRFNAFVPSLMRKVCGALRSMNNAPGVILDLRGNQGGLLGMVGGLTGLLETTPTPMGRMHTRSGAIPLFVFPQTSPYSGPLVILVDGSTQSAAEMFASGLQEAGRATLVGEKTAGNTLPSAIKKLPTGALFQYGFANYETQTGQTLEGFGIIPDKTVALSRKNLLRGGDPQLSAALRQLRGDIRSGSMPVELVADVSTTFNAPRVVAASRPSISIRVDQPPPMVVAEPPPPPAPAANRRSVNVESAPTVDAILKKYLEASGGKDALEKISSRVSTGTVEITALGITGSVELDEQAPNKLSLIINAPGLGVMQKTFDGNRAWLQDPLQGFISFTGVGLEMAKAGAIFNKPLEFKDLSSSAIFEGKEKLGIRDVYVVRIGFEKFYFDADNGLLLRKGNTYYDDYREVDGVKLPFNMRDDVFSGVGLIYRLNEIKHNVKIDESKFAAYPSCFTKP
jgi:carboxyl-terminal processing protease